MKKIIAAMLLAVLLAEALSAFAEDMPVIDWTIRSDKSNPAMQTGEISDSWEEIIDAIDDGAAQERYAVGATKALDLGELGVVHMQLAGFYLDARSDGSDKATTTWIAREILPEAHRMNNMRTTKDGWEQSELRDYLQSAVMPALPVLIRRSLISVRKQQETDESVQITDDLLWIPDGEEVFGPSALYYELFQDEKSRWIKEREGSASWWWLRSAKFTEYFRRVNSTGDHDYANVLDKGGIVLGFCL